jgi:hypothetical protein
MGADYSGESGTTLSTPVRLMSLKLEIPLILPTTLKQFVDLAGDFNELLEIIRQYAESNWGEETGT